MWGREDRRRQGKKMNTVSKMCSTEWDRSSNPFSFSCHVLSERVGVLDASDVNWIRAIISNPTVAEHMAAGRFAGWIY